MRKCYFFITLRIISGCDLKYQRKEKVSAVSLAHKYTQPGANKQNLSLHDVVKKLLEILVFLILITT